jgi:hypothetical protein
MLQSVEVPVTIVSASLPEPVETVRFDWLGALKQELAAVGVATGNTSQCTPKDALLGYRQALVFQGQSLTLNAVIGEANRLVLRLTVTRGDKEVVISYLARLSDGRQFGDTTWEELGRHLQARRSSFNVFAKYLIKALEQGTLLH